MTANKTDSRSPKHAPKKSDSESERKRGSRRMPNLHNFWLIQKTVTQSKSRILKREREGGAGRENSRERKYRLERARKRRALNTDTLEPSMRVGDG